MCFLWSFLTEFKLLYTPSVRLYIIELSHKLRQQMLKSILSFVVIVFVLLSTLFSTLFGQIYQNV